MDSQNGHNNGKVVRQNGGASPPYNMYQQQQTPPQQQQLQPPQTTSIPCSPRPTVVFSSSLTFKPPGGLIPKPNTALDLLQQQFDQYQREPPISLFPQRPDLVLSPHQLSQLAGPAGSGKTQLALQLCVRQALESKSSVYLTLGFHGMGDTKISRRLKAMLVASNSTSNTNTNTTSNTAPTTTPPTDEFITQHLNRIFLGRVVNPDDLWETLDQKLPQLLQKQNATSKTDCPISLIIMDSIANLFRIPEEDTISQQQASFVVSKWYARSSQFFQIAAACQRLASKYNVAFLFLNQVTAQIHNNGSMLSPSSLQRLKPALGLSWSQCMNTTYMIKRWDSLYTSGQRQTRTMQCWQSPTIAPADAQFFIDQRGPILVTPTNTPPQ